MNDIEKLRQVEENIMSAIELLGELVDLEVNAYIADDLEHRQKQLAQVRHSLTHLSNHIQARSFNTDRPYTVNEFRITNI